MEKMKTVSLNKELKKLLPDIEEFEPELFRNFITYWIMRKSDSLDSTKTLNKIKNLNPSAWINLIESNHKFRSLYGEEIAQELIKIIKTTI